MYPSELIPQNNYKGTINTKDLLSKHPSVRLLRKSKGEAFRDLFPKKVDVFGYSTFQFGHYKNAHIIFKTSDDPIWRENDTCLDPNGVPFTEEKVLLTPFYLEATRIHECQFPLNKKSNNGITESIPVKIMISHRPSSYNYWHFELVVFDLEDKEITRQTAEKVRWYERSAGDFAEEFLMTLFENKVPEEILLIPELYIRTTPESAPQK